MLSAAARRGGGIVVTLLVASFVVYSSIYLSPGSPEDALFGSRQPSPAARAAVRHHLGLDQPFAVRYWHWLADVLHGNFGTSLVTQQAVSARLAGPLLITTELVAYAALLILVLGIGLGLLAAVRPGVVDAVVTVLVSLATAVPAFVAAALGISLFAVRLRWLPSYGLGAGVWGHVRGLTLPALSLAIISSGLLARVTRAEARDQLASDHVQTARARGLSRARTLRSHVLRNSAGPVVSVAGLQVAGLFSAAVVVEEVFGLGGLGQELLTAVQQKDFPVVQAISLILVVAFVGLNLVADLVVVALDPRARRRAAT